MASLNDIKFQAITDAGFTSGSLNDREYQWLAEHTSISSGLTLNDQWMTYMTLLGYSSGTLNDRQMQAWADMGYGFENLLLEDGDNLLLEDGFKLIIEHTPTDWPGMAKAFWTAGGLFNYGFLLLETGGIDDLLLETGDKLLLQ